MAGRFKVETKSLLIDNAIKLTSYSIFAAIALLPLVLFYNSLPLLKVNSLITIMFSGWEPDNIVYGLGEFILASLILALCSTVLSFVLGLSLSLFIYNYRGKFKGKAIRRLVVIMSGIPTVAYGFVGIILLVPFIREHTSSPTGLSLLATIIMLSILILPTIVSYINQSFAGLPESVKIASLSLGASKAQFYIYTLIPHSLNAIAIAMLLGFARAISDTMIALMISGNSFQFPSSLLESSRALTAHIGLVLPGEFDGIEFKAVFFASLILFVLILMFNLVIYSLERKKHE